MKRSIRMLAAAAALSAAMIAQHVVERHRIEQSFKPDCRLRNFIQQLVADLILPAPSETAFRHGLLDFCTSQ
jgi:hypothetical protein